MEDIRIYCENTQTYMKVAMGTDLNEVSQSLCAAGFCTETPVLAALVEREFGLSL